MMEAENGSVELVIVNPFAWGEKTGVTPANG
jgi:hypothetical protein